MQISGKKIIRAFSEKNDVGVFVGTDKRKGKIAVNKIPEEELNTARKHIDEFPRVEPHYCRRDSEMQYLSPELNISKMYDLYLTDFCVRQNVAKPITAQNYRDIFVTEYNLKCFTPKKISVLHVMHITMEVLHTRKRSRQMH